ncbi:hypothetical protein [Chlamydia avium]|uniref:hypothetical protein n=1 Tax=Chlamydia avium TaxID=1457141 RepID=UPI001F143C2F|nr:hypothetical protein [Chlamydia avium]
MHRRICLRFFICVFLFIRGGVATAIDLPSQSFCSGVTKYWFKNPKEVQEKQHMHFLHHVIAAIKQPEIWNDSSHLLNILLQFEKFPEKNNLCHHLLITIILNRITLLTM